MLNEREERELAEIERELAGAEPGLANRLDRHERRGAGWAAAAAVAGVVVGVLLVLLGLVGNALLVVAVAGAPLAWRRWGRHRGTRRPAEPDAP